MIVPVLDEARALPRLLDDLEALVGRFEVIVADGGSSDGSIDIARARGVRVTAAGVGRAGQLNAAAEQARGSVLLFLHADTELPPSAYARLMTALSNPLCIGGNFRVRFDGGDRFARFLGVFYAVGRRLGIYYGDSAIFVRADVFRRLGGFRPLTIMEDYDFARRLERHGRTACLPDAVVTSSRRWQELGVRRTLFAWIVIQSLFVLGVRTERLVRIYPKPR